MTTNLLIHKNSYSKIHSAITYGCSSLFGGVQLVNVHNKIYDIALSLNPKTIILQIEEYTQEIHSFLHDRSLPKYNVILTMDNIPSRYEKFISMIEDINRNMQISFRLFVPAAVYSRLLDKGINAQSLIAYDKVYNNFIFNKQNLSRNNKILCILDDDIACVEYIKPYLYPKAVTPIVMVNNPQVQLDQNIGLLFDTDMNNALNSYGSVIDLSGAYSAEISVCGIPAYDASNIDKTIFTTYVPQPLSLETTSIESFIKQIKEYIL